MGERLKQRVWADRNALEQRLDALGWTHGRLLEKLDELVQPAPSEPLGDSDGGTAEGEPGPAPDEGGAE